MYITNWRKFMFHYVMEPYHYEKKLIDDYSQTRHLASEPHIRIQVITIPYYDGDKYFEFHGELLLIALKGEGYVKTKKRKIEFKKDDQVLLTDGDPFYLSSKAPDTAMIVQFIWTPGLNPCEHCWNIANRFYKK